jgi:hypothetical protein
MTMRMRLSQIVVGAIGLCIASGADAATFGAFRGTGVAMTRTAFMPSGFSHGTKIGFAGRNVPPGWSEGRKVGWNHGSRPPGLRR